MITKEQAKALRKMALTHATQAVGIMRYLEGVGMLSIAKEAKEEQAWQKLKSYVVGMVEE